MIGAAEEDSETEAEKVRRDMARRGSLKVISNRLTQAQLLRSKDLGNYLNPEFAFLKQIREGLTDKDN